MYYFIYKIKFTKHFINQLILFIFISNYIFFIHSFFIFYSDLIFYLFFYSHIFPSCIFCYFFLVLDILTKNNHTLKFYLYCPPPFFQFNIRKLLANALILISFINNKNELIYRAIFLFKCNFLMIFKGQYFINFEKKEN